MKKFDFLPPALVFIIGFLTFGIGNLFFVYYFSDLIFKDAKGNVIVPMREFVLNIMTLGIYGIIWTCKVSRLIDKAEGVGVSGLTVLSTVLSAIFLRSVSMTIISVRLTGETVSDK